MSRKREGISAINDPLTKKTRVENQVIIGSELAEKCIRNIRVLAAEVVEKANSGHPGAPMGCAPMAHLLWGEFMNYNPSAPNWSNRDRFILSNGHACALLYSMLHLSGYAISMDDLKQFRQLDSITPGHPENFATPGVEVSTGPLGQGISNAVGFAIAERQLAATYNREGYDIVDHYTYVICGDGCLQEGISSEASSLGGHLGLGKLIVLYDDNRITIDGDTALSFTEDVAQRYTAYGWHVQVVDDVNDLDTLRAAIQNAKEVEDQPSMIKVRTVIGEGSLSAGKHSVHGSPLGSADLAQVKAKYGYNPEESFVVHDDVRAVYTGRNGAAAHAAWDVLFQSYSTAYPELAADFTRRMNGILPAGWKDRLPRFPAEQETKALGTRNHSEIVLNAIAAALPEIIGGSADLTPSNLTSLKCSGDFQKSTPAGRYLRFGVREHGMVAISNGLFAYGGFRPFCATFLNFAGYALGAIRLSSLSRFGVLLVMTHDSIGLGEDGPTHQPIEMLESLRSLPNMHVFRPADGNEVCGSYICAIESLHTPSVLALSRQVAPGLVGSSPEKVAFGAYVLSTYGDESVGLILVATGTEVQLAVKVAKVLSSGSLTVRVVSMPCWELFDQQSVDYQREVLLDGVPVISIEASASHGWSRWSHSPVGMTTYGVSAPFGKVYERFGFTVDNIVQHAYRVIEFYKDRPVPSLVDQVRFESPASHHHH